VTVNRWPPNASGFVKPLIIRLGTAASPLEMFNAAPLHYPAAFGHLAAGAAIARYRRSICQFVCGSVFVSE